MLLLSLFVLSHKEGDEPESLPGITELTQGGSCHLDILEPVSFKVCPAAKHEDSGPR